MDLQERNKKVEENLKLVSHSLNLLKVPWNEDYFQQGVLELIRCVENYDESKGYKFSTYAIKCITLKLKDYIKRDFIIKPKLTDLKKGKVYAPPVISLNQVVYNRPDDKPIILEDTLPYDMRWEDIDLKLDLKTILEDMVFDEIISEEELQLFIDAEINGYSVRDLSRMHNKSVKQIKQQIKRIRETLQKNIMYN